MARGAKKEKALTPEEKLAQALVPEAEQPYPVPENWRWVRLGSLASVKGGKRVPKGQHLSEENTKHPYIRVTDFDNYGVDFSEIKYVDDAAFAAIKNYTISVKDIYISIAGSIGKIGIIPDFLDGANLTENAAKITDINGIGQKCLLWYLASEFAQDQMKESTISTTQPKLALFRIENILTPLPPLPEQQRIVDRIESLFAKLDEAKEKAQAVVDGLGEIHESYLYQAFTGELTANWRRANSNNSAIWENRTLQSVCSMKITDGTHQTPTYCEKDEGIPFISAKDVTSGEICWDNIKYIVPELHDELYARLAPRLDDVLLAKNGTTGVAAIVDIDKVFDLYVTLAVLRPDKTVINPRYLLNVVNSPICKRQFNEHLTGIGVPNLHLRDIKAVTIPLPSLDEQAEIVRVLDKVTSKWKQAKEAAEQVIDQIDTMKKAILARAFRGELGTNNPTEESAEGILSVK